MFNTSYSAAEALVLNSSSMALLKACLPDDPVVASAQSVVSTNIYQEVCIRFFSSGLNVVFGFLSS